MNLLDLVFPKRCVGCGKDGGYVCRECEVGMWEEEQICPVCRLPNKFGLRHRYCRRPLTMEGLTCLWAYEGIARKLITRSKYRGHFDYLGELTIGGLQLAVRPELGYFWKFLAGKPMLVPVPLHPARERKRGFNQAEIIASIAARQWGLDTVNLLRRVKDTGQQVGRGRNERLKRMEGAFALSSKFESLKLHIPEQVLLVDDVWTTGATMSECAKELRKAGVRRVWGWVLAR